jgi:predicted ABC-type ATPase
MKRILIIAGPNGAGKTTFAMKYLPNEGGYETFINADMIAAGLSPLHLETQAVPAGRLMLDLMDEAVANNQSFALETTLSGRAYMARIKGWRDLGYKGAACLLTAAQCRFCDPTRA